MRFFPKKSKKIHRKAEKMILSSFPPKMNTIFGFLVEFPVEKDQNLEIFKNWPKIEKKH